MPSTKKNASWSDHLSTAVALEARAGLSRSDMQHDITRLEQLKHTNIALSSLNENKHGIIWTQKFRKNELAFS